MKRSFVVAIFIATFAFVFPAFAQVPETSSALAPASSPGGAGGVRLATDLVDDCMPVATSPSEVACSIASDDGTAITVLGDLNVFDVYAVDITASGLTTTDGLAVGGAGATIDHIFALIGESQSIADDGAGTSPNLQLDLGALNATQKITCLDANNCTATLGETLAIDGLIAILANVGTNTITWSDSAGVLELQGTYVTGQYDVLVVQYQTDRWIEVDRSDASGLYLPLAGGTMTGQAADCITASGTTTGTVTLDFSTSACSTLTIVATGAISFEGTNYAAGRHAKVYIDANGSNRTISYDPQWQIHGVVDTEVANGEWLLCTFDSLTSSDTGVHGACSETLP